MESWSRRANVWARVLWRLKEVQDQAEKVRVGKIVEDEKAFAVY